MQVDHEIKLTAAHVFDDPENSQHGERLESVAQRDAIDGDGCVSVAGHLDYFRAWLADSDGDARMRKALADCGERGQAHHRVAELAEIDDKDIARVKSHFRCLSKKSALA